MLMATQWIRSTWDTITNQWMNSVKYTFDNKETQKSIYNWNSTTNQWKGIYRRDFSYAYNYTNYYSSTVLKTQHLTSNELIHTTHLQVFTAILFLQKKVVTL